MRKILKLTAQNVALLTGSILSNVGRKPLSITNDNGSEMNVSEVNGIKVYYCQPLKPQQRGTVENTIGLLRQFLSRQTDLDTVPDEKIDEIEKLLNSRPRKCLDYRTPYEVFYGKPVALAL